MSLGEVFGAAEKVLPVLARCPLPYRIAASAWFVLTLTGAVVLLGIFPFVKPEAPALDDFVDQAAKNLAALDAAAPPISEQRVLEALRPLVHRPGFIDIREEPPEVLLFGLYHTQRMLEKPSNDVRLSLGKQNAMTYLVTRVVKLEQTIDRLYGDDLHLHTTLGQDKAKAVALLESRRQRGNGLDPFSEPFQGEANGVIAEIRKAANEAGI